MRLKFKRKKTCGKKKFAVYGKRAISILLCAGMIAPSLGSLSVKAAEVPPIPLESSRISKDKFPEGDFVYFGTAGAKVKEEGDYAVKVFREGDNLDKKATVEVRTVDMTAVYGEDYELLMDDVEEKGDGVSLLEKYSTNKQKKSNIIDPVLSDKDSLIEDAKTKKTAEDSLIEDAKTEKTAKKAASVSTLAKDKENQTGSEARDLVDSEEGSITQALQDSLAASAMEDTEYSSSCKLTFAPGEQEKTVVFRILEDDESEGTEGFTLMLAKPAGAEIYEVGTSSISIEDDEPKEKSEISFTEKSYTSENGKAVITVKRTGAKQSICDLTILTSGVTAKAGTNYVQKHEEIAFKPYETEKKIEMDVTGEGTFHVILKDFKGCKKGKYTKASVKIVKESQKEEKKESAKAGGGKNNTAKSGNTSSEARMRKAASGTSKEFGITVYGQNYTVRYNSGDGTGKIMDTRYDPELQVGVYYFASEPWNGGIFSYNKKNSSGYDACNKQCSYKSGDPGYGRIEWYDWQTWSQGQIWAQSQHKIPGVYYQYFVPDWASTSDFGGGQKEKLEIIGDNRRMPSGKQEGGKFGRTQSRGAVDNRKDEYLEARIYAIDQEPNMTPKTYIDFYGLISMYRKFKVSLQPYEDMQFLDGARDKIQAQPVNISIECGAESLTDRNAHDIYANLDEQQSNLVLKCSNGNVSGNSSTFATISGYKISIDSGGSVNNIVDLNYPSDFIGWMERKLLPQRKPPGMVSSSNSSIRFTSYTVEKEIEKVERDLTVIPYDAYFLKWINECQRAVKDNPVGYEQALKIKPILKQKDITVEVLNPTKGKGHFNNHGLTPGKHTFHAGDTLDLTATSDDKNFVAKREYQVSTDNFITYDTIQSTSELFLSPKYDSYQIRPVMRKVGIDNFVEVTYASSSDEKDYPLAEGQLISQDALAKYPQLKGKKILNLNPTGKTLMEQIEPVPGNVYNLSLAYDPFTSETKTKTVPVYKTTSTMTFGEFQKMQREAWKKQHKRIPTSDYYRKYQKREKVGEKKVTYTVTRARTCSIKMKTKNTTYNTNYFPFVAASNVEDNVIEIGMGKTYFVDDTSDNISSDWDSYELTGNIMSNYKSIRPSAKDTERLPVVGSSVMAGSSERTTQKNSLGKNIYVPETITSVTDDHGGFSLKGIHGAQGMVVPVAVSDGTNSQIIDVTLGKDTRTIVDGTPYKQNTGVSYLNYPYSAPYVSSIDYQYGSSANNKKTNRNDNNIKAYDDQLTVTATIQDQGREVKEAVFTLYTMTGQQKEYTATASGGHASFTIPQMMETVHNGDRIKVRLVDREDRKVENGEVIYDSEGNRSEALSLPIEYPDVDTGLIFNVENVRLIPKSFDAMKAPECNVPILGTATGNTQSGQITFGKTQWPETINGPTGYSLQVGLDACFGQKAESLTANKKVSNYKKFNEGVQAAAAAGKTSGGEDLILESAELGGGNTDLTVEKQKTQSAMDVLNNSGASGKADPFADLKKPKWSLDIAMVLQFDFVYTNRGDYEFYCGAVAIGGTFTFNKSFYAMLGVVPGFLNFYATVQANATIPYTTNAGQRAVSAGEFDEYAGNIGTWLAAPPDAIVNLMIGGKFQPGVGLCGVVSARGYIAADIQLDIGIYDTTDVGGLFLLNGGIGVDLAIFTFNFDIMNFRQGIGSLANQQKLDFFGGMVSAVDKKAKKAQKTDTKDRVLKKSKNGESLVMHENTYGTSDMSKFGKGDGLKRAMLEMASVTPLLDNAAERTRPRIIPLGDGKKLAVFIGARADEKKTGALYYTIYDGSKWAEPMLVAEDGTVDAAPDVLKVNDKVIIAWSDANRAFTAEDTAKSKLSAFGISTAIYDIKENKMGEEITLVDDGYCNFPPQLNVDGSKIFCSYMKRDVSKAEKDEDLASITSIYSTMAYITYDYDQKVRNKEEYIKIEHQTLQDPIVMDYTSATTQVNGDTYLLSTYTIDEDEKLKTHDDKELYLAIYNSSKDKTYYPIKITSDSVSQAEPKLTDINGTMYLTWIEDGCEFKILDVTEILEAVFDTSKQKFEISNVDADGNASKKEITINKDVFVNGYISESDKHADWYKRSAADLGVDAEFYESSVYEKLANGTFNIDTGNFSQNEEDTTNISDYQVVTDGDDMYVFYVAPKDSQSSGNELFGARYKRFVRNKDSEYDMDKETEDEWGFGKAVQITDRNKVIDEISLYMTEDGKVSALSNFFDQWLGDDGKIQTSSNKLVEIEFETANSMEVKDGKITLPSNLIEGQTDLLEFEVINDGLLTTKGFDYKVTQKNGSAETEIDSGHIDTRLEAGDSEKVIVPWKMENLAGASVEVTVTETGVTNNKPYTVSMKVPNDSALEFTDTQVLWRDKTPYVKTVAKNNGVSKSQATTGKLYMLDEQNKVKKTYATFEIPALSSGEEKAFEIDFSPEVNDFNHMGIIEMKLAAEQNSRMLAEDLTMLQLPKPMFATLNGGKDVSLAYGEKKQLKAEAAPWNSMAGEVRYSSSNSSVATVDDKGVVTGAAKGNAVITAYYPASGLEASVKVSVAANNKAGTKKIKPAKKSVVIAAGKSKTVKLKLTVDSSAAKTSAVKASIGSKKVVSKAKISKNAVRITAAKKAKKGASTTITLKSKNAAGKTVSAKIKVLIQNKVKKVSAKKKTLSVKKSKKAKLTLKVTAQNKKKATTDSVKILSKKVTLKSAKAQKGKITLTLAGKKKGKHKIVIKVGRKKVKVTVKVK